MKCPTCGTQGAYIGFISVECPNRECMHFNANCVPVLDFCGVEEKRVNALKEATAFVNAIVSNLCGSGYTRP